MASTPASRPAAVETAVAAWQARLGLTDRAAASALGMSLSAYQAQKLGRENGKPRSASRALLLACAAIEAGLQPIDH